MKSRRVSHELPSYPPLKSPPKRGLSNLSLTTVNLHIPCKSSRRVYRGHVGAGPAFPRGYAFGLSLQPDRPFDVYIQAIDAFVH